MAAAGAGLVFVIAMKTNSKVAAALFLTITFFSILSSFYNVSKGVICKSDYCDKIAHVEVKGLCVKLQLLSETAIMPRRDTFSPLFLQSSFYYRSLRPKRDVTYKTSVTLLQPHACIEYRQGKATRCPLLSFVTSQQCQFIFEHNFFL